MTVNASTPPSQFGTLAIVGVGLLGGSAALAARARGLVRRVIGVGRNAARLEAARQAGVIDVGSTELDVISQADLAIVCTPVDRLALDILAVAEQLPDHATVTDVGSIKREIVTCVSPSAWSYKYVPAHPLAGSEQTGWEAGSAQLFAGRLCVVTPFPGIDPERLALVEHFWRGLEMRTVQVSPEEHDRRLALTSHLPHVVAAGLAALVGKDELSFAATGFRDTTRIAAGDPAIWTPILMGNAEPVLAALGKYERQLGDLRQALLSRDADAVSAWLTAARQKREAL